MKARVEFVDYKFLRVYRNIAFCVCDFRDEQEQLKQKLSVIEKKIIVGGENLLEKAEEQERLLEESARELEERKEKEEELKKALEEKEVQFCDIYSLKYSG